MGIATRITLFFAISYFCVCLASEDVELKDPHLVVIATFAANTILKDADDFGIQNTSSLHRIMDAHIVPFQQPIVILYLCCGYYHVLNLCLFFFSAHPIHAYPWAWE